MRKPQIRIVTLLLAVAILALASAIIYSAKNCQTSEDASLAPVEKNPYDFSDLGGVPVGSGPKPSEESVKSLLKAMGARDAMDELMKQSASSINNFRNEFAAQTGFTPKETMRLNEIMAEQANMVSNKLSWERLEPIYIRAYQNTLTQRDVEDLTILYRSQFGWLLRTKMPLAGAEVNLRLQPLLTSVLMEGEKITEKNLDGTSQTLRSK